MGSRKGKLPPSRTSDSLAYRTGTVQVSTPEGMRLVLATGAAVRVWDYQERAIVDEYLRMDGLEYPRQLPLLNSHNRDEARDVIGSIRDLEIANGRLEGVAYFASGEQAQDVRQLYDEGHLTDFSIGFQPTAVERVPRGETKVIAGQEYTGPARVVTRAKAKEGSAVAIGADEYAKVLREYPALRAYVCPDMCEEEEMEELRNFALLRGMPADTPDSGIVQWMADNLVNAAERNDEKHTETRKEEPREVQLADDEHVRETLREAERIRSATITAMCAAHNLSQQQAASYIRTSLTVGEIAQDILKKIVTRGRSPQDGSTGTRVLPMEAETDKFMDGARGALVSRCLTGVNLDRAERHAKGEYDVNGVRHETSKREDAALESIEEVRTLMKSPHTRDFRNVGLCDMARMFAERAGVNTWGRSRQDIVRDAFRVDLYTRAEAAYHTTGSFTNILLDAANKTLLAAYAEASVTYPLWVRQAPSAADYKTINRIRLGEIPSPDIVPENAPYGEVTTTDNKESYTLDKYGHIFSISLEAIINDDLNAISRIPAQQGMGMRRKINQVCYAILTANAALSDGVALFHASSHGANLDANALSVSALNTGFTIMMTQTGLTSGVYLNIMPRFLIVPPSLAATAYQLTMSMADPTNTAGTTEDASRPNYNSGVVNLYGPNGPRRLVPVVEAVLESSTTRWFLAAEASQVDTVELTFLQGEETPYLDRQDEFTVDAVRYKIRQTFAAKAIDYRGLYQGNA